MTMSCGVAVWVPGDEPDPCTSSDWPLRRIPGQGRGAYSGLHGRVVIGCVDMGPPEPAVARRTRTAGHGQTDQFVCQDRAGEHQAVKRQRALVVVVSMPHLAG